MRRIISALLICISSWALAQGTKPLELAPDAPDRHVVVPGDTLWDISAMFLKDPFRWPEIWRLNAEDIKNPHWIYPGQVVILDRSGDSPRLKLGKIVDSGNTVKASPRVYADSQREPIPAIPQSVIEPFLSQPLVLEAGALDASARIVAIRGGRIRVGRGDTVYVTRAGEKAAQWQVFRAGKPLIDPDRPDGDKPTDVLGYEAEYLGTARQTQTGEPATFEITSSRQEIERNDYLLPAPRTDIVTYVPHAPEKAISGRIIRLYGGVSEGGKFSIVSISRGKNDGVEVGHVLAIYRTGDVVANVHNDRKESYTLPEERYGLLFVFRTFERVSYALIMDAPRPVLEGDTVRNP